MWSISLRFATWGLYIYMLYTTHAWWLVNAHGLCCIYTCLMLYITSFMYMQCGPSQYAMLRKGFTFYFWRCDVSKTSYLIHQFDMCQQTNDTWTYFHYGSFEAEVWAAFAPVLATFAMESQFVEKLVSDSCRLHQRWTAVCNKLSWKGLCTQHQAAIDYCLIHIALSLYIWIYV